MATTTNNRLGSDELVSVEGISKKFCKNLRKSLWYGLKDIASELLPSQQTEGINLGLEAPFERRLAGRTMAERRSVLRSREFWAVNGVSFSLNRGECLGLVGANGAGKTTLLKLLNGLVKPDAGRIRIAGKVGALIALGAGFNPILTGRENILVSAAILGFSRGQIQGMVDEIIEFSEIGDYIDSPVLSYSSGMQVRLGFAIASRLKPDVLLVDEVLAVGDVRFRLKCLSEISKLLARSAVILVSHSSQQLAKVCTHGLVMEKGVAKAGKQPIDEALLNYARTCGEEAVDVVSLDGLEDPLWHLECLRPDQGPGMQACSNRAQTLTISRPEPSGILVRIRARRLGPLGRLRITLSLEDDERRLVAQLSTSVLHAADFSGDSGIMDFSLCANELPLNTGRFKVNISMKELQPFRLERVLLKVDGVATIECCGNEFLGAAPVILHLDAKPGVTRTGE